MKQIETVGELITYAEENYSDPKALNTYEDGAWKSYSTQEYLTEVKYIALALRKLGLQKEGMVGIYFAPSARWSIVDLAIMSAGGVSIPIFVNISEENFLFEVQQTELSIIFISGNEPEENYKKHKDLFKKVISIDGKASEPNAMAYEDLLDLGKSLDIEQPHLFKEMLDILKADDTATIIYTSGSTGIPKGAVHTHKSLTYFLHKDYFHWDRATDKYLSILPLAHVFARTVNTIMLCWGISIYYSNDLKNLGTICQEVHPTILVVVPRLLEKLYAKMLAKVDSEGYLKRTIGHWAFDLANQEEDTTWKPLFHPLAEKLVYGHLRDALGGSLRVVFCGGAPLDPHLYHFFIDVGLPIYEGWGQTEGCPITFNRQEKIKIGTIGPPISGMEMKIADNGELLVRGPLVMKEYYKNPQATAETIDKDGWLHTGDKGSVDEDGYFTIEGRLKELLKTSTGENIAPIPIEQALTKASFVETAIVIANSRKFVSCLLVPDFEIVKNMKSKNNMENLSDEEFLNSDLIKHETQQLIHNINAKLSRWEQIRAFRFIPHNLSVESGELTPSLKVVRNSIEKKYKDLIDSMYNEPMNNHEEAI